ncbi:hypothetical protein Baya_16208 [Bagarius yarrelli]|uniref:ZP-C domain-containing protein n=1 Tax=Bagarius yarrelli TaxID=175774 RepID=A0A556VV90_BAGYA|nr:hypothetical protein Baya_16208 [Bagarius yarrelli]
MVVRGHADLYGTGRLVPASELRLGAESKAGNCGAVQRENNELVITAGLHECGAKLRVKTELKPNNFLSERSLDLSEPNEVVAMVASVLSAHQTVPKLFLDRCEATLEPDTAATPTSDLINDWCPAKSNISFLPRADSHVLRIKLNLPSLGPDGGRAKRSVSRT